jgi:hypothetical protein
MKPLSRLESLIAEIVERPAWALSSRRLNPLELTAALTKEMEARAVRLVDRVLAPDRYELRLNATDLAVLEESRDLLERELAGYLERLIAERDLTAYRPPEVRIVAGGGVRAGRVQVSATFSPARGSRRPAAPEPATIADLGDQRERVRPSRQEQPGPAAGTRPAGAALQLLGPDDEVVRSFPLGQMNATIGRRNGCDIPLFDTKVSREHARIEPGSGGYAVADLGSLNGTFVNGRQVEGSRQLHDGDVLEVGRHRLRFAG